jgi:phage-related protein
MKVILEQLVEWRLAGETEVPGENLPQRHFVHHNPTWQDPGSNPGRRGGKPATNRLSYGAAERFLVWIQKRRVSLV